MEILVIGCGVSGLTTGLSLLDAGYTVSIWAKELPPHTTSNVPAAVWYPYKAYPIDKVTAWGKTALHKFKELEADRDSGIIMTKILQVLAMPSPDPWWATGIDNFRHANREELPVGYLDGYIFETPVIDTTIYLNYLMQSFQTRGGCILQRAVTNLAEAFEQSTIVVNCSGLGARELVGDHDLHPARGQIIRIKPNGFRHVLLDEDGPNKLAYIVPRTHDIVLGGTYEENNESTEINPNDTQNILLRCANLAPEFLSVAHEDITSIVCGLRPVRSVVRVEIERITSERFIIHNYGHGGAGITISWGCATEVVDLVQKCL